MTTKLKIWYRWVAISATTSFMIFSDFRQKNHQYRLGIVTRYYNL